MSVLVHYHCNAFARVRPTRKVALRRNPAGRLMDGVFRYTLQFEEQRLDEGSGMAGLPGVSE